MGYRGMGSSMGASGSSVTVSQLALCLDHEMVLQEIQSCVCLFVLSPAPPPLCFRAASSPGPTPHLRQDFSRRRCPWFPLGRYHTQFEFIQASAAELDLGGLLQLSLQRLPAIFACERVILYVPIRPHLRQDLATSAPGLSRICART